MSDTTQNRHEGIAIVGMGCYFPKANGIQQFWNNILGKVDCITDIPKNRWDPAVYYDPDKNAPDKTYSKIGGFVNDMDFSILTRKYKIPPKVLVALDIAQKFALLATIDALNDAGYKEKEFDRSRTAVIIGNSMGGDKMDYTNFRVFLGDVESSLKKIPAFTGIDKELQKQIVNELVGGIKSQLPEINEDTMPGELANVIAGRISNALNLTGPSFSVDAACASSLASLKEATRGLLSGDFDMAVAGGSDFLMGPGPYVKFSKIGALSPDGSRPFDAGANGFIMGEGSGIVILKRVSDARKDGNKIYAIITGIGASADGKGKGITAPNPKGQTLAVGRAFKEAGYSPDTVQYVEAHGTSTVVGDVSEMEGLLAVWGNKGIPNSSVGIGSIKSNIGHLKAASASASVIKLALSLYNKIMPPSINYKTPNPSIKFGKIPFRVITEQETWPAGKNGNPRRGNASAFGFGGTNFHATLEEDTGSNGMPEQKKYYSGTEFINETPAGAVSMNIHNSGVCDYSQKKYQLSDDDNKKQEGETVVLGGSSWSDINEKINKLKQELSENKTSLSSLVKRFNPESNSMDYRAGISAFSTEEFADKLKSIPEGFENLKKRMVLKNKGLFFGEHLLEKKKSLPKICLMFPGQGTQYINMLKDLYNKYKVVKDSFDEADAVMYNVMGKGISEIIFQDENASKGELESAEQELNKTEILQPGVLTADYAMFRLLRSFGINPQVVMGHSLGEYGALVAAGVMSFKDALYAVSARGREVASYNWKDVGKMVSVPIFYQKAEELMNGITGYISIANKNCNSQTVVGGESQAVKQFLEKCESQGIPGQEIPVSHAFHTKILEPVGDSYRKTLEKFNIKAPVIDIIANLTGEYYPKGNDARSKIIDMLVKHISSPVEFIKQVERIYADGVGVFVEAGPSRTLSSFILSILDKRPHLAVATNHSKRGGIGTLNDALAAISVQGYDIDWNGTDETGKKMNDPSWRLRSYQVRQGSAVSGPAIVENKYEAKSINSNNMEVTQNQNNIKGNYMAPTEKKEPSDALSDILSTDILSDETFYGTYKTRHSELVKSILETYSKKSEELMKEQLKEALRYKREMERFGINTDKIMISGVSMGLPGERFRVFDDNAFERIAQGINMIDPVPIDTREKIAEKNIVRLVKKSDGEASFSTITDKKDVIKLAGRKGQFSFEQDYGFDKEYASKLEITTQLAIAAGIEALRDAGIPLVMNYKKTTTNKLLPAFWALPAHMQDDTGVIFAAAFPGENSVIEELNKALAYKYATKSKKELIKLYLSLIERIQDPKIREELSGWYAEHYSILKDATESDIYEFNNKFIFKILVMGHSQFAELIKAKGPNIHINSACSSTTVGIGIAEDWIRTGRAKRVIVIAADDVTSNAFIEWILSGFLAVGAATTQERVEDAAIPFDRRRSGFIVGMGAAGIVIEAESELRARGMEPIVEVVSTEFSNSAFHGTRIDNDHVTYVMEKTIAKAEDRLNLKREEIAKKLLFMSHETYTPARGGSATSEIFALRNTFKDSYKDIIISNTKGFTGHTMAVGVEDVVAVKALQTGKVPPIANFKEVDPELGILNLSKGGSYDHIEYALRLGAGFGSQIAMSILKLVSKKEDRVVEKNLYADWLKKMSGVDNPQLEIVHRTLRVKEDASKLKRERVSVETSAQPVAEVQPVYKTTEQKLQIQVPVQAAANLGEIHKKIMKIVGEKTGYPEDLIEFDLDMESDLGIDTVKQAEMFGMIRETFHIPADENIRIKDFPTLNHVVEFVRSKSPMQFSSSAPAASVSAGQVYASQTSASSAGMSQGTGEIHKKIMKIVGEKTGYPEDLIEFDLDMESDLGIDTVKQAEMFGMIREAFSIPADESIRIKDFPTLNHVVEFVRSKSPMKFAASAISQAVPVNSAQSAASATVTSQGSGMDEIHRKIVKIVEEKTGYSEDLIEFDLDMESDLGIDTVKQAEMFGTIRETFNIPADESIRIKDFPTLNHVVEFVRSKSPMKFASVPLSQAVTAPVSQVSNIQSSTSSASAVQSAPGFDEIRRKVVKIVEEKTGYSEDLIEFDLDMESDLGIDTVKQAEMFGMIRETFNIPADESIIIKNFPTLNHVIEFVRTKSPIYAGLQAATNAATISNAVTQQTSAPSTAAVKSAGPVDANTQEIRKKIVKIVEEKTGYSEDLIEFDLDMESDLGIDTVKQAEMFGMIRESFNIPADESIIIKDFPTLNHVIEFVKSKSPSYAGSVLAAAGTEKHTAKAEQTNAGEVAKESKIKRMTLETVEVPLDEKAGNRFTDMKGFNVLITEDGRGIAEEMEKLLTESGATVNIIKLSELLNTNSLDKAIERARKTGKVNSIVHLAGVENSDGIDQMNYDDWKANVFKRVKSLFYISKSLEQDIRENGKLKKSFIVSLTDMGGSFGIDEFTANHPIGGGVQGLTKALDKEFNMDSRDILVKAIDMRLKESSKPASIAKTIMTEIQKGDMRVEAGYTGKTRLAPQVIYKDVDKDAAPNIKLDENSVILVTGGGYGITSAIAKDLAKNLKIRLAVISLESMPQNIKELVNLDESGLKQLKDKVIGELKSNNERVTPVMIDKEYAKYTIAIDIYRNLEEMKMLGSPDVEYYSCNVMDHKAMTEVIGKIRERFGRIDGVIHGAGINADKFIADKTFDVFSRVVDVKVDGCFNLIETLKNDNLKVFVTFASIAGRFGNIGQTDYSSANDMLNKYVQHAAKRFSGIRAVSMNWSGWKDVGMATRASITKLFEEGGIDMISLQEGVTRVREDLLYGTDNEVLIAGRVGYIDRDNIIVGYKTKEFNALAEKIKSKDKYPMIDEIVNYIPGKSITIKKHLDTETDLYLMDHAIEDIPYLPAVMGIETFAETAVLLAPKSKVKLMKDIRFNIPVKILKGKPVDLIVTAEKAGSADGEITIKTKLETEFFNKDGKKLGDNKLHFEATVVLSDKGVDKKQFDIDGIDLEVFKRYEADGKRVIDEKEIYKRFFHGPKFQVLGGVISIDDNRVYGLMPLKEGMLSEHFSNTKKPGFISNPMAIEAAFQNAGIYPMAKKFKMSLPDGIRELAFIKIPADVKELYVSAKYVGGDNIKHECDTEILDSKGNVYSVMKGYKMINTGDLKEDEKF